MRTDLQQRLLLALVDGHATIGRLAERTQANFHDTHAALDALCASGMVYRTQDGRYGLEV